MQKLRTMQRLRSDVNSDVYMLHSPHEIERVRVERHRFRTLYHHFICRILKTRAIPQGNKMKVLGVSNWDEAIELFKSLEGYQPKLKIAGMRLEPINASLSYPEIAHRSNLKFVKFHKVRKPRPVKMAGMEKEKVRRLVEVIDLAVLESNSRIPAKKLHDIVRKCLNSQTNAPIVNVIRTVMESRGWKCWATYDECWYERL